MNNFSLVQGMMREAALYNITYHPILDNYKEFENVTKVPFNPAFTFPLSQSIELGNLYSI